MGEACFLEVLLKVLSKGGLQSKGPHVTKYWKEGALNCEICEGSHFSGTP